MANRRKPPDNIIVLALRSMSGEITPNMRLVAFGYGEKHAKFRFYMSEEPSDGERENGEVVAVNFDAGHPTRLERLDVEFVVANDPLGKLDPLDFVMFARSE